MLLFTNINVSDRFEHFLIIYECDIIVDVYKFS